MQLDRRLLQFTEALMAAQRWRVRRLGPSVTPLMFDLMCVVARNSLRGTPAGVKELTMSLAYSDAGVRKALRLCVEQGWVRVESGSTDRRVRLLHAQPGLLQLLREYELLLSSVMAARQ